MGRVHPVFVPSRTKTSTDASERWILIERNSRDFQMLTHRVFELGTQVKL